MYSIHLSKTVVLFVLAFLGCDGFELEMLAHVCRWKIDDTVSWTVGTSFKLKAEKVFLRIMFLIYVVILRLCT